MNLELLSERINFDFSTFKISSKSTWLRCVELLSCMNNGLSLKLLIQTFDFKNLCFPTRSICPTQLPLRSSLDNHFLSTGTSSR